MRAMLWPTVMTYVMTSELILRKPKYTQQFFPIILKNTAWKKSFGMNETQPSDSYKLYSYKNVCSSVKVTKLLNVNRLFHSWHFPCQKFNLGFFSPISYIWGF